jgi:metal-responsive CopG/Arc/MetJ family transcriptional regulator
MEDKEKVNISIDIEKQLNEKLEKIKANKSELIDYLLEEYFKAEDKKDKD